MNVFRCYASALIVVLTALATGPASASQEVLRLAPRAALTQIAANDNTLPGGHLRNGVLRLDLVAQRGLWYPDGPGTLGLPIEAFGERGKPLQIPGPLVSVPLGTRVIATIRNELGHELTVRGFAAPAEAMTSLNHIAPGATRRLAFVLDRPGAFGYYGSDDRGASGNNPSQTLGTRIFRDAELSGAIVVAKPHAPPLDHVFVLGLYAPVKLTGGAPNFLYMLETINGRSFPATERLTYRRGQTVRWAVYNASAMTHPMHLHGFYFHVERPIPYDEVTHAFHPGDAQELTWTADRAGEWMYHCHISDHITPHEPLADMLHHRAAPHEINAVAVAKRFHNPGAIMAGMVIALHVAPRPGDAAPVAAAAPRPLGLTFAVRHTAPEPYPRLEQALISLHDGDHTSQSSAELGPAIVLTRGEPVAITVTNQTHESTSVHWHGVALADSYYDGGAGMGMAMHGERMSPQIEPGGSFVAEFAPPDAGTFMYHAHMDDGWQLGSGFDGPLIVMPPGASLDTATDHVLMISETYEQAGSPFVAIGGSMTPEPITMSAGVMQRLRLGELTLGGQDLVVSLVDGSTVATWTPLAKDGRDLPAALRRAGQATSAMTIGETRDFAFTPAHPGALALKVFDLNNNGMLVGTQPIVVK